jgi:hypothetical protein
MKRVLMIASLIFACPLFVYAQDMKPLSPEDKAEVEELLKSFDPNSYKIQYQHTDSSGNIKTTKKGLANIKQSATIYNNSARKRSVGSVMGSASGNLSVVVDGKKAATNTNINVFKEAATNTNVNVFKDAGMQSKAERLNAILQKYHQ